MSRLHRALLLFGRPAYAPRETIYRRRRIAAVGFLLGVALGVLLATGRFSCGGPAEAQAVATEADELAALHALRVRKCERLVATFYANSGFLPYCETLVATHERMEAEGGERARGFGAAWYWSLVYGAANFGLRVGGVAPGSCAGPMDVKHRPLVLDPVANIEWHCREMLGFYKRGVRGRDLCEHVMLPAAPRDWGGGRFRRTDARFRACIERGYEVGKLP
jgi:hypothetical protein